MPGGDKTGPMGFGPMTGRGVGICAGYGVPGYMNPAFGRGFGGGRGRGFGRGFQGGGRGWRHQYYATGLPGWAQGSANPYPYPAEYTGGYGPAVNTTTAQADELAYLKEQARNLKGALDDIEARVGELQREKADSSKAQEKEKK